MPMPRNICSESAVFSWQLWRNSRKLCPPTTLLKLSMRSHRRFLSISCPYLPQLFFQELVTSHVSDVSTTSATGFCTDMPIPIFSICFSRACRLVIFFESMSLRTMLANSARRPCENSYFPQLLSCLLRSG